MRIMYLTQWFEPEPNIVKGIGFVRALQAAGHRVTVVTGLPNYPHGKIYPEYKFRLVQSETVSGITIVRLPLYSSHDASSLRRSLTFLSFCISAFLFCIARGGRFDLAYVYHPPITVGLAAALAGRVRRLPFVLDIQDLWPDTVAVTGMTGARRIARLLGALCNFVYRRAAAIIVQSDGMGRTLIDRGVSRHKLTTVHNWSDVETSDAVRQPDVIPANGRPFTIIYGGNLGRAQGLEAVIEAVALLQRRRTDFQILFYGGGIEEARLRRQAEESCPSMLQICPRVSQAEIVRIFTAADALLLHLRDDPLFAITIPSKTQFYLAMGKPIIAGIAGEAAELLNESGAAVVTPPGDVEALAAGIAMLIDMPMAARRSMAERGKRFYAEKLSFDQGMGRTLDVLEGIYLHDAKGTDPSP